MHVRWCRLTAIGVALLMLATACGSDSEPPAGGDLDDQTDASQPSAPTTDGGDTTDDRDPGDETSITIAWSAGATTLDIGKATGGHDSLALDNVYDALVRRARDGQPEPALAESWEYSEDGTEVTVQLREGVLFHNGEEMTADDVAYSLNRWIDPDFPVAQASVNYENVLGTDVIDDYTVLIRFSRPEPNWIHTSTEHSVVVPASVGEEFGFDGLGTSPESTVGTGPYRVVDWTRDDLLVLEAFEDHWRGRPAIDHVTIRGIPDESARTAALLSGDADIAHNFNIEQLDVLEGRPDVEARVTTSLLRQMITLNAHERPGTPLEQREVREALALALDLQSIIDNILDGLGELVPIITLPIEPGFNDELEPYPYDPDRARELLDEAGYGDGIDDLVFITRSREPKASEVAQAIQAMWADVGINTTLTVLGDDDFARVNTDDDFDMTVWGFRGGGTFYPSHHLNTIFGCDEGSGTWARSFCNEDVYEILTELAPAAELVGQEEAFELYREAQRILHEEFAFAGIWSSPWVFGVRSDLNWEPHPEGNMWMFDASW